MTPEEVARVCDELHECVDQGPGENPGTLARALSAVLALRADASWEYPINILTEIELQLTRWFSPEIWRGTDEELRCRENLLDHISRLEDAWDRPRS